MLGWKRFNSWISLQIKWLVWVIGLALLSVAPLQAQSVLKTGTWVKIGVTRSGVHRLSQAQLSRIAPAFAAANPRLLRLYGNGGAVLPQANAVPRPSDLIENAIQVTGDADGRFDADDAILFFGQSPHIIRYDSVARGFTHQINPYADTTFYFLTIGASAGLRITERTTGPLTATTVVSSFDDYQFHEKDLAKVTAVRSGREWLGEYLTNDTTFVTSFDMTGRIASAPVRLRSSVMAGSLVPTQFSWQINGQNAGVVPIEAIYGYNNQLYEYGYQGKMGRADTVLTTLNSSENPLRVSVTFRKNGNSSANGYLDFLAIQARRELRQYDGATWVRRLPAGQYAVRQATTNLRIWNVTNPLRPASQAYALTAAQEAAWSSNQSADYFLFTDAQFISPASLQPIVNQDLHSQASANLLIITPPAWRSQAERLATFRREHDKLSVLVVTTQEVYNEFGSGQPDPTAIRDAVRYFYQKTPGQLRYLLLFGDATYDYRNIARGSTAEQLANMVPVYESRESLHPVISYSSDDYYGFMGDLEGEWPETMAGDYRMVVGVGRLPAKSPEEAQNLVDKLIRYSADPTLTGDWQTRLMFIADDGDFDGYAPLHQRDADQLATRAEKTAPAYRPERVFVDDYPQESSSGQQKAPVVNQIINQGIADGQLIINYSGHGGVLTLADEQIVTIQDILSWKNRRLPLMVTATCQFGRYDDPSTTSGAELALLSRTGGAIGLLTTTRPVYANSNLVLNQAFYDAVFTPIDGQSGKEMPGKEMPGKEMPGKEMPGKEMPGKEMPRMGDVMRLTKNNSLLGPNNRNFALLGDPSMRLAYPKAQVVLTNVNGRNVTASLSDTLQALETVELTGEVRQLDQRLTDFTGTIRLTLYDKAVTHTTLGAEADSPKMTYKAYSNLIFTGQVPVQQGRFTARFTVPKDIDYAIGRGKLMFYAVRSDSLFDAAGGTDGVYIGGSVSSDNVDNEPPTVALSVVGATVTNEVAHAVGPDVTVRVALSDNRGINIARSGLGHELTAQLDSQSPVVLNELYVANGVDGRAGEAYYTFRQLAPGTYSVRVKAWDINNNSTQAALTIVVSERPGLALKTLRTSPNPIGSQATVLAELNRNGEPLDWTMGVYDLKGQLLNQQTGQCSDCAATLNVGTWDGRTGAGQPLQNGLYLIRIQVRSGADGSSATGSQRVVLMK